MVNVIFWNTFQQESYPFLARPLGPHLLSKWLNIHGISSKVIDFSSYLTTDELVNLTEKYIGPSTVAIGVSNTFWSDFRGSFNRNFRDFREPQWVLDARAIIEERHSKIKWLLGGAARNFGNYRLDWEIFPVGYAEDGLLKFFNEKVDSKFSINTHRTCWVHGNSIKPDEVLSLELARGCHFKCKFCTFPMLGKEKNSYLRNFDYVKEELLYNYGEFGITRYNIVDDTINESPEKIKAFAKITSELPFRVEWLGYNRLDLIYSDRGTAELLRDSGLKAAFFGIETLHKEASKAIGKGWMGKYARDYLPELRNIWGPNISITGQFIVGLPYESIESMNNTNNWLLEQQGLINYWQWGPLHMDRSWQVSEFDKHFSEYGIRFPHPLRNKYWEHDIMNFPQAQDLAQQFNDDPRRKNKVDVFCWQFPSILMYGHTFNSIINKKAYQVVAELNIAEHARNFIAQYYQDQINLMY